MSAFDRIIGYDHIKAELMQISDMIHHPEVYAALDAKLPQGLLLSGAPGLGKTLMATALIGPLLILNPPLCKWLLRHRRVYSGAELHRQGAGEAGVRDRHRQQCEGDPRFSATVRAV